MSRSVVWSDRASRDLSRLDRIAARRALAAEARYAETEQGDVKHLVNVEPPMWRLRVGDYRVRFRFDIFEPPKTEHAIADTPGRGAQQPKPESGPTECLLIQRVLHRREVYRGSEVIRRPSGLRASQPTAHGLSWLHGRKSFVAAGRTHG